MMRNMYKNFLKLNIFFMFIAVSSFCSADRIKDIADVAGVRSNQLIGFGLVGGLSGTVMAETCELQDKA
jgi:flagellar P-ring protein precursor FlgI